MFDGNFRSRKEINLSSRSAAGRRRAGGGPTADNKQALLRIAEEQRRQRQEHQRRTQAARQYSTSFRGWITRLHILDQMLPLSVQSLTATSFIVTKLKPLLTLRATTVVRILVNYLQQSSSTHEAQPSSDCEDMDLGSSHGSKSVPNNPAWYSEKRLVQATLRELSPDGVDTADMDSLFSLLQTHWPSLLAKKPPDDELYLDLNTCLGRWVSVPTSSKSNLIVSTLCRWAVATCHMIHNPHARALLASVLLSGEKSFLSILPGDSYSSWVVPLATSLESEMLGDPLQHATRLNLQHGREQKLLSNLLENDPRFLLKVQEEPSAIIQIVYQVLCRGGDVTLMASLLVRGDSLDAAKSQSTPTPIAEIIEIDDSDDEDYDDGEGTKDAAGSSSALHTSKVSKPSNRLLGRRDLLTLPKLDKIYQDCIEKQKRDCRSLNVSSAIKSSAVAKLSMATTLVKAPWLNWGLCVLKDTSQSHATQRLFVESLGLLVQSISGLRTSTKIGPLSGLALNKEFMLYLWRYTAKYATRNHDSSAHGALSLSIFCDLFAHYLIALSDSDFVQFHTGQDLGELSRCILAGDVIETLRDVLYDLYWNNPVLADEVASQSPRGRLVLSATKVWSSLYERWNRLVRTTSFADESMWMFPHLSSREGDRAVAVSRERRDIRRDHDFMDIDDEEADSDGDDQQISASAVDMETDALADAFADPKMARILTSIPQAIPFGRRVKLFSSLLKSDKQKTMQAASSRAALMAMGGEEALEMFFDGIARERVTIRRAKLYEDSMQQLSELGSKLKHKIQVSFVNQHGAEEAGIDGGGVFKEFLDDLIKDGFASRSDPNEANPGAGAPSLFSVTPLQMLAINFDVAEDEAMLEHYEFLGRVLGKAV